MLQHRHGGCPDRYVRVECVFFKPCVVFVHGAHFKEDMMRTILGIMVLIIFCSCAAEQLMDSNVTESYQFKDRFAIDSRFGLETFSVPGVTQNYKVVVMTDLDTRVEYLIMYDTYGGRVAMTRLWEE